MIIASILFSISSICIVYATLKLESAIEDLIIHDKMRAEDTKQKLKLIAETSLKQSKHYQIGVEKTDKIASEFIKETFAKEDELLRLMKSNSELVESIKQLINAKS